MQTSRYNYPPLECPIIHSYKANALCAGCGLNLELLSPLPQSYRLPMAQPFSTPTASYLDFSTANSSVSPNLLAGTSLIDSQDISSRDDNYATMPLEYSASGSGINPSLQSFEAAGGSFDPNVHIYGEGGDSSTFDFRDAYYKASADGTIFTKELQAGYTGGSALRSAPSRSVSVYTVNDDGEDQGGSKENLMEKCTLRVENLQEQLDSAVAKQKQDSEIYDKNLSAARESQSLYESHTDVKFQRLDAELREIRMSFDLGLQQIDNKLAAKGYEQSANGDVLKNSIDAVAGNVACLRSSHDDLHAIVRESKSFYDNTTPTMRDLAREVKEDLRAEFYSKLTMLQSHLSSEVQIASTKRWDKTTGQINGLIQVVGSIEGDVNTLRGSMSGVENGVTGIMRELKDLAEKEDDGDDDEEDSTGAVISL